MSVIENTQEKKPNIKDIEIKNEILKLVSQRDKFDYNRKLLEKINSLTPNSNTIKRNFYTKKAQSLKSTQKYFHETKTLSHIELKEYSFLYLILNNLQIIQENFHLIENVKLFTKENKLIFENIFNRLANGENFSIDEFNLAFGRIRELKMAIYY